MRFFSFMLGLSRVLVLLFIAAAWFMVSAFGTADAGEIGNGLARALAARGPSDPVRVIVHLKHGVTAGWGRDDRKSVRRSKIIKALKDDAESSQPTVLRHLHRINAGSVRSLWIIDGIAAAVPANEVSVLAALPEVERVILDAEVRAPATVLASAGAPEWNISRVTAPDLWAKGFTGQGIVVANMDTGVDAGHPDLQGRWRGGANSWFDANNEHQTPYDAAGHGTQTMGLIVGGDAGGTSIGMAPGAQWVAVKIFNDAGTASYSAIHLGFQWLLDPDGDPLTDDAPDVVNSSWGLDAAGSCVTEFQPDVQVLRASGMFLAFSAGNNGPGASSDISPANYPESFSAGSVDSSNVVATSSSRGPSACGSGLFPSVTAPGLGVRTADLFLGIPDPYATVQGTSFAAPHVAGAAALLLSAFPGASVPMLERALSLSAVDLGAPGPDNDYGSGLIDVAGAHRFLSSSRLGVYANGTWYLDQDGNGQWEGVTVDKEASFGIGLQDAFPVAGDWTGNGVVRIGVFDKGTWYLDLNGNETWDGGPTDVQLFFGIDVAGAVPVTGDWTGSGTTKLGVYANGIWYLDLNGNGAWDGVPVDGRFTFGTGIANAVPVVGNWSGTGTSHIGVFDHGTWYLDLDGSGTWDGTPTDGRYTFGLGLTGATPVVGDWDGSGITRIGVYQDGTWYLDVDGNGEWGGAAADRLFSFGFPAARPVPGRW